MIDIKSFPEALYLTWIPKLVDRQEEHNIWMAYPSAVFSQLGLNFDILAAPESNHTNRPHWSTTKYD